VENKSFEMIKVLFQYGYQGLKLKDQEPFFGAEFKTYTYEFLQPALLAVENNSIDIFQFFCDQNVWDVNALFTEQRIQCHNRRLAQEERRIRTLHLCAKLNHLNFIERLIGELNADPTLPDDKGLLPYEYGAKAGVQKAIKRGLSSKRFAFILGLHPRLGEASSIGSFINNEIFDPHVLLLIFRLLNWATEEEIQENQKKRAKLREKRIALETKKATQLAKKQAKKRAKKELRNKNKR